MSATAMLARTGSTCDPAGGRRRFRVRMIRARVSPWNEARSAGSIAIVESTVAPRHRRNMSTSAARGDARATRPDGARNIGRERALVECHR